MVHRTASLLLGSVLLCALGCGASLTRAEAADLRRQLRDALSVPVETRDQRDAQSRLLADIAGKGVFEGLNYTEVRAALGTGRACRTDLCSAQGFRDSDWYFEIGVERGKEVKQIPVLILGFDPRGRVVRVYTLTTH
jgi:hypothetical protein